MIKDANIRMEYMKGSGNYIQEWNIGMKERRERKGERKRQRIKGRCGCRMSETEMLTNEMYEKIWEYVGEVKMENG